MKVEDAIPRVLCPLRFTFPSRASRHAGSRAKSGGLRVRAFELLSLPCMG